MNNYIGGSYIFSYTETTDRISDENTGNIRTRKGMNKSEVEIWTEMISSDREEPSSQNI